MNFNMRNKSLFLSKDPLTPLRGWEWIRFGSLIFRFCLLAPVVAIAFITAGALALIWWPILIVWSHLEDEKRGDRDGLETGD